MKKKQEPVLRPSRFFYKLPWWNYKKSPFTFTCLPNASTDFKAPHVVESHCCDPLCSAVSYSPVPELLLLPGKCDISCVAPTLVSMQLPLATAEECDTPAAAPLRPCAPDPSPALLPVFENTTSSNSVSSLYLIILLNIHFHVLK